MSDLMLDDVKISMQKFGVPDYLVFVLMLVVCALIGVYFGFIEKKPAKKCDEESDYLVGGRQMKVIPITMSLIARYEKKTKPNPLIVFYDNFHLFGIEQIQTK